MKKAVSFAIATVLLFGESLPMPPMMPPMPPMKPTPQKATSSRPKSSIKDQLPKECKMIPPMLVLLPPPLEQDLRKCKNRMHLPTKERAKKALQKLLRIKKVEAVEGFDMLYKISTNWGDFYCNKDLSKCIRGAKQ